MERRPGRASGAAKPPITGNEPENRIARLAFWRRMTRKEAGSPSSWPARRTQCPIGPRCSVEFRDSSSPQDFFGANIRLGADNAEFYSTAPLEKTRRSQTNQT
jgi:hypothetical protein